MGNALKTIRVAVLLAATFLWSCQCDDPAGAQDAGGGKNGDGVVDAGGGIPEDAGPADSGVADAGLFDSGPTDAGDVDAGGADSGPIIDSGATDSGSPDAGMTTADSGSTDSGNFNPPDSGSTADAGAGGMPAACVGKGLCVVLEWSGNNNDVDLHLSREYADWCTDQSCYFANCKESTAMPVDWDGDMGFTSGDPRIVVDSMNQALPEILVVDDPRIGDYVLGVYHHPPDGSADIDATVSVYSFDVEVFSTSRTFGPDRFWQLGFIVVTASDLTVNHIPRLCAQDEWICNDAVSQCAPVP
jgi:hypothetical protein